MWQVTARSDYAAWHQIAVASASQKVTKLKTKSSFCQKKKENPSNCTKTAIKKGHVQFSYLYFAKKGHLHTKNVRKNMHKLMYCYLQADLDLRNEKIFKSTKCHRSSILFHKGSLFTLINLEDLPVVICITMCINKYKFNKKRVCLTK